MSEKRKTLFEKEVERLYREHELTPEKYQQIRKSKAYMEAHYCEKVELSQLAQAAFMSRYHFVRVFQKMYGLTPRVYLRDLRIAKAKELLQQGKSITQVCFEVGYESLPTFSSIFKKCTGNTPKMFQKLNKSNLE